MSKKVFVITTALLIGFIMTMTSMTVRSQSRQFSVDDKTYREMEKSYIADMKQVLEQDGIYNTGITMTKTYHEDGSRSYQVQLHNKYIDLLSESAQQELMEELEEIPFPITDCSFHHFFA